MRFRPCIDIHGGKVKQIVGGSLCDETGRAVENFVSEQGAAWYAAKYAADGLDGGHIILLDPASSPAYEADAEQARMALGAAPGRFAVGGGMTPENASRFLDAGASHVIVTSYIFQNGRVSEERLSAMEASVGKEHLILDISCRQQKDTGEWVIVTDRWQTWTDTPMNAETAAYLAAFCDEFLIHAADVEGKQNGPELAVVSRLASFAGAFGETHGRNVLTYAGGIRSFEDIESIYRCGKGRVDITIGSALDLFGGPLPYRQVLDFVKNQAGKSMA